MYLAELKISNFRKISTATLRFQEGLNVLVGANNVGKTAVIDALRALLGGHEEPYPRFSVDDIHHPTGGQPNGDILFEYIFKGLSADDEADFHQGFAPGEAGNHEIKINICYRNADNGGRLRIKRWCGDHEERSVNSEMLENLRGVYLQPLRDPSQGLRPGRTSQLARLLVLLTQPDEQERLTRILGRIDARLKRHTPIAATETAITSRHGSMLGPALAQALKIGLSASDFKRLSSRLSLSADEFEIDQNGLGFNNLIYMAVVLSELVKNRDASYRGLIVEEPEAHLHPQLQAVLLKYLQSIQAAVDEKPVQLFVTSHSPNFASIADLSSLTCIVQTPTGVETFFPREVAFGPGKKEKLVRYLDVTRAEMFFARRVIFVEGAAELTLVSVLADKIGKNLRSHGVSIISVEGLNFDCFLPLFGENALKIPTCVITDADPGAEEDDAGTATPVYPGPDDTVDVCANTTLMLGRQDSLVKVKHGKKTFEYDLALKSTNRPTMLKALKEIHPGIGARLETTVNAETGDAAQAKALFRGMFERTSNNVQKGGFAQALAAQIADKGEPFDVPDYIKEAIEHACQS